MRLFVVVLSFCLFGCKEKYETKEHNFPEVGWTISLPTDFKMMDSAQIQQLNNKGATAIQNTYDTTIDFAQTKTLFSMTEGQYNYMTATLTAFNAERDGNWFENNEGLKVVLMETFRSQTPGVKIDSSSTTKNIGGLEFSVFQLDLVYPNKMKMRMNSYSRLHKGYDFGITMCYVDEAEGKKLENAVLTSKFIKP
jgi:hypothetical protein